MFKFCSKLEESFLDLLKGSAKLEIVNALSNKFSLNDKRKEVSFTSREKNLKLLHSSLYLNRNIIDGEHLSNLNNSNEGKILNSKNPHSPLLISLEGHSKEKIKNEPKKKG